MERNLRKFTGFSRFVHSVRNYDLSDGLMFVTKTLTEYQDNPMKKRIAILSLIIVALILTACSSNKVTTTEANSAQLVYTSVAASLTAQAAKNPTSTSTVQKTATPTGIPTENFSALPTHVKDALTSSSVSVCDNVAYVSDITIPDGTVVSPGEAFTKTWRVQNTGTCNWTTSYVIGFITGETMEGESTVLTSDVYSGNQIDISVEMVAPSTTGTYVGYWKLQNSGGTSFGETLYVQIKVVESTATQTPTITNTPTSTTEATSTSTTAPAATETPAPTSTPEIAPTETTAA